MPQQPMNQASSSQQPRPQAPPDRPNELQAALLSLTNTQTQFMTETRSSIRNIETQVGQLVNMLNNRPQGNLPSNIEVNPKKQCQAITLRSGKQIEHSSVQQSVVQNEDLGEKSDTVEQGVTEDHKSTEKIPPIPSYVKFMKEILSKKRNMEGYETVALTEECSAILQRKLPQKLRDPGSFTIPCTIGKFECKHALCDLGASINLMPLSVFRRLSLGEARPTTVTLQLADRLEDANMPIILGRPFLATGQALIDVQKGELKL
ncbi:uncharacterized protein LOC133779449 [Humulus lupulus]|uniref:uncharacterized protein LOC133779449 n=1 Tax=Humulus lupulus TaxID=3486 RepID=UPI002B40BFFE|nr:uncharacterized protein LOC133779449 [Humulus lupulus]